MAYHVPSITVYVEIKIKLGISFVEIWKQENFWKEK